MATRILILATLWLSAFCAAPVFAGQAENTVNTQICGGGWERGIVAEYNISQNICKTYCPNCSQCFARQIRCAADARLVGIISESNPYKSDAQNALDIQEARARRDANLRRTAINEKYWYPLTPLPQLLLLVCFIGSTIIGWFGIKDTEEFWRLLVLVPLNIYFAIAVLFFNADTNSLQAAQILNDEIFFHSWIFYVAVFAFGIIIYKPFLIGWHYLWVEHPAEPIINQAIDDGQAIDGDALAKALTPTGIDLFDIQQPAWYSEQQTKKARALKEKLDEDARLAEAAIARERAWAAKMARE